MKKCVVRVDGCSQHIVVLVKLRAEGMSADVVSFACKIEERIRFSLWLRSPWVLYKGAARGIRRLRAPARHEIAALHPLGFARVQSYPLVVAGVAVRQILLA